MLAWRAVRVRWRSDLEELKVPTKAWKFVREVAVGSRELEPSSWGSPTARRRKGEVAETAGLRGVCERTVLTKALLKTEDPGVGKPQPWNRG